MRYQHLVFVINEEMMMMMGDTLRYTSPLNLVVAQPYRLLTPTLASTLTGKIHTSVRHASDTLKIQKNMHTNHTGLYSV